MPDWSTQQASIFEWFERKTEQSRRNCCVRARAGTGKTTTILEGINHAPEEAILLCAFNKDIATELAQRLQNPRAEAKTLHAVGLGFVTRAWGRQGIDGDRGKKLAGIACERAAREDDFRRKGNLSEDQIQDMIKERCTYNKLLQIVESDPKDEGATRMLAPRAIVTAVSKIATLVKETAPFDVEDPQVIEDITFDFDCLPENYDVYEMQGWKMPRIIQCAQTALRMAKNKDPANVIDFADMLYIPLANGLVTGKWDLVCVDECQDMNTSQLELALRACKKGGRIAVIGDDRQAIYGFRGAASDSVDRLKQRLDAVELGLTITYRCPQKVVALAQELVPDIQAAPNAPEGAVNGMMFDKLAETVQIGDFVLSRTNAPLVSICLAVLQRGIRAKVQGRDIGKGLVALVRQLKPSSIPNFLERLGRWERKKIERLIAADREDNIAEVKDKAETLRALAMGLSGVPELEMRIESLFSDDKGPAVTCSTVHRAKGREAKNVYLLKETFRQFNGMDGGLEEKNIRYVAITRAKETLIWVANPDAEKKTWKGPVA